MNKIATYDLSYVKILSKYSQIVYRKTKVTDLLRKFLFHKHLFHMELLKLITCFGVLPL